MRDERGTPVRPWLTVILDDYSRAVAGYRLSLSAPTALNTALALRQAIWRKGDPRWHVCGIPQTFYTDHGSDFTSRHLEQVAVDLEMVLVFSEPGSPAAGGGSSASSRRSISSSSARCRAMHPRRTARRDAADAPGA